MTAATATAAATVSQELCVFGRALGVGHPGTKYPVWGIPHFDVDTDVVRIGPGSHFENINHTV